MADLLFQSRAAPARVRGVRPQGAPGAFPNPAAPNRRRDKLPPTQVGLSDAAGEPTRRVDAEPPLSIGSLLYLGSIGLIGAGIVAVLFGAGFSLLVRTAVVTISGSVARADPQIMSLPPSLGNVEQQTFFGQASAHGNDGASQNSAALPAPTEATAIGGKDNAPHLTGVLSSKAPTDTPAAPANAPVPAPSSPAPTASAPPSSEFSNAEMTELLNHGDALLRNGDVVSARLFYERAADAGDGRAALRLGATYDPAFLGRLGLARLQANPVKARSWYNRALDLGAVDAKHQLNSLDTRQGNSFQ